MKPLVFNFPKEEKKDKIKIDKKVISLFLIAVAIAGILAGYYFLEKTGRLEKIDLSAMVGKIANFYTGEKAATNIKSGEAAVTTVKPFGPGTEIPLSSGETYEETAQRGEGITHLARRALNDYLSKKGLNLGLTPEHRVYIEDYIQNRTGNYGLALGQKITFSEDLIVEAINSARGLTSNQLENLHQYSVRVSHF